MLESQGFHAGIALAPRLFMETNLESWTRFERWLESMRPGDVLTVAHAVVETGMAPESVQLVFEALTRAALLERHGDYFLRIPVRAA